MISPEYCSIFEDTGEITVEVKFKNFDGNVRNFQMNAKEILKLIDPESGQFYSEMDFDEWRFFVYKYEIDPIRKKMVIRATGDLNYIGKNKLKKIHWEQAEKILEKFIIFQGKGNISWFREAWNSIENANLADYKNDDEKQIVLTRAITIGVVYNEFFQITMGENFDFDSIMKILFECYKEVGFNISKLSRIVGKPLISELNTYFYQFSEILFEINSRNRKQIGQCLKRHFGGDESLLSSIWFSRYPLVTKIHEEDVKIQIPEEIYFRGYEYVSLNMPGVDL